MDNSIAASDVRPVTSNHLLKILGIGFGVAIVVGAVIGGQVIKTAGLLAAYLGNEWLILGVLLFGAIWALLGANVYAELGTMLPEAGGGYVFLRRAYGDFIGFAGGMNDFLINVCAVAYITIVCSEFFCELFPRLKGYENWIAVVQIAALGTLNWLGLREGELSQKLMSLAKVLLFATFIAVCFAYGGSVNNPTSEWTVNFESPFALFAAVMLSSQIVNESYAGWYSSVYFSEENTDPSRNIPRSMFIGILIVAVAYILIYSGFMYVLPLAEMAASPVAGAAVADKVFGANGASAVTVFGIVTTIGIANAILLYGPRVPFAMARDGLLPQSVMRVNRGGTPAIALGLLVLFGSLAALSGTFESLLAMTAFFALIGDSFVYVALFVLRRREPDLPRPFKAYGYPYLPILVLLIASVFMVGYVVSNPRNSLYALGIIALFYPAYLTVKRFVGAQPEIDNGAN